MRIKPISIRLESRKSILKNNKPPILDSLREAAFPVTMKNVKYFLLLFVLFSGCAINTDQAQGIELPHPAKPLVVYNYIQNNQPSESDYYMMQLILTDIDGNVLDSVNSRISAVLPYHIEWLEDGKQLAIKGKYQITRIFDLVGAELRRDRSWSQDLKAKDDYMWQKLSEKY